MVGCWTRPWNTRQSLGLDPTIDVPRGIALIADIYDMPQLKSLPAEIADLIHGYSSTHCMAIRRGAWSA